MFKLEPKIVNVPVGPWNAVVGVVVQAVVPLPSRDRVLQSRHKMTLFFRIGGPVTSKGLRLIFSCERVKVSAGRTRSPLLGRGAMTLA